MSKVALITTQVEEFESREALEHYVKDHAPFEFDDKVDLLKSGKVVIDLEDDTTVTIEIANELAPVEGAEGKEDGQGE